MSENKQEPKFPCYKKNSAQGVYFKFFNLWKYSAIKIRESKQGIHFSYMNTEATKENIMFLLEEYGLEESNKKEYDDKLIMYADNGVKIKESLTQKKNEKK